MSKTKKIACFILTRQGLELARQIRVKFKEQGQDLDIFAPVELSGEFEQAFVSLKLALEQQWGQCKALIFVAAAGLTVRLIAPLIKHKSCDPAVLVCEQRGKFVISLLSGHLGGANELAREVASLIQGQAVITTATDVEQVLAIDELARLKNWGFADYGEIKHINMALISQVAVGVYDPLGLFDFSVYEGFYPLGNAENSENMEYAKKAKPRLSLTLAPVPASSGLLRLHPKVIHAGVGCKKGVSLAALKQAMWAGFEQINYHPATLASFNTVDLKAHEPALLELCRELNIDLQVFTVQDLKDIPTPHVSEQAGKLFGCKPFSVCESAALAGAVKGKLILEKQKYKAQDSLGITLALAYSELERGENSVEDCGSWAWSGSVHECSSGCGC